MHHCVIGAQPFNTTTRSQNTGYKSPSDSLPHSRGMKTSAAPVQMQKPSNSQRTQLLNSESTDICILIVEDETTIASRNAVHPVTQHPSRMETVVILSSNMYLLSTMNHNTLVEIHQFMIMEHHILKITCIEHSHIQCTSPYFFTLSPDFQY
jgi:hypothetical protein